MNKLLKHGIDVCRDVTVRIQASIRDAAQSLSDSSMKIVFIANDDDKLVGSVTDGDIRRGLLSGLALDQSVKNVMCRTPVYVREGQTTADVAKVFREKKVLYLPELDETGKMSGLYVWAEEKTSEVLDVPMVIIAGGKGTRLKPYTDKCPKPMVPLNGKPILEHVINQAKAEGFRKFFIVVNHLGDMIEDYFDRGQRLGIDISYFRESKPLGTAGGLALIDPSVSTAFVISNCDIVTSVPYASLLDFHVSNEADATMAIRAYTWQHPFGVVITKGSNIVGFQEKPSFSWNINAGIYVLSRTALGLVKRGTRCDMPALFERLRLKKKRTIAYPVYESWADVGRPEDLIGAETSQNLLKSH
jgi:dTDP-glucose pyrophosphorylase